MQHRKGQTIATIVKKAASRTPRIKESVQPAGPVIEPDELKDRIYASLDGDKAEELLVIPLAGRSALADYMIIASGTSTRQVASMADHLREVMQKLGLKPPRMEGMREANWVVVDAGDVIVHLFRPEVRSFYNLEKMWVIEPDAS